MALRESYEATIEHMLEYLDDEGRYILPKEEKVKKAVKNMVNDQQFIEEFADFLENHMNEFGHNYGFED